MYIKYIDAQKTDFRLRKIEAKNNIIRDVHFLVCSQLTWHSPLDCRKCFPKDNLLKERTLVETDRTSTVPTQQLRQKKAFVQDTECNERTRNNKVLLKLFDSGCIKYGHISRGKNHYQYYINTQRFFYYVQNDVIDWLKGLREQWASNCHDNQYYPILNIIFVPEHNTNVGFAQFINTYYFNGTAEVISINVDKEYRTNFICEHKGIKETIEKLLVQWDNNIDKCPIKFFFADDSVITGYALNRANDLLFSLLPQNKIMYFPVRLFSEAFVLVDRLSLSSKNAYIKQPGKNYHAYLHINISSMRTNGDSCICCKLKKEAEALFAKSATKELAEYWYNKIQNRNIMPFDDDEQYAKKEYSESEAELRLLISHIAYSYFFTDNKYLETKELRQMIEMLYLEIIADTSAENKKAGIEQLSFDTVDKIHIKDTELINKVKESCKNPIKRVELLTKVLSRPYFSYDIKLKQAMLEYLLSLANDVLNNNVGNEIVKLLQRERTADRLNFLKDTILKSLSDMRSNYYLRKNAITILVNYVENLCIENSNIANDVADFYKHLAAFIHSSIDCGRDDSRPLWFEYMLLFGEEFGGSDNKNFNSLYYTIAGKNKSGKTAKHVRHFCDELLLMNTSILFRGIENCVNVNSNNFNDKRQADYFMDCWKDFRKLSKTSVDDMNGNPVKSEIKLFDAVVELYKGKDACNEKGYNNKPLSGRYHDVFNKLTDALKQKYISVIDNLSYALLTYYEQRDTEEKEISNFDIISMTGITEGKTIDFKASLKRYDIKRFVRDKSQEDMEHYGYAFDVEHSKFVIFFDNPPNVNEQNNGLEYHSGRRLKSIAPVYLYIDYEFNQDISDESVKEKYSRLIARDILVYRNRIMRSLEADFSSDIFGQYAHKRDEAHLVAHEKALSHATTTDDAVEYEILAKEPSDKETLKWMIFKGYVNRQIGRLYCRTFSSQAISESAGTDGKNAVPLCISKNSTYDIDRRTEFMYQPIHNLNQLVNDARYTMLEQLVDMRWPDDVDILNERLIVSNGKMYNREYFLCIIFDIIFTGIKFYAGVGYKFDDLVKMYYEQPKAYKRIFDPNTPIEFSKKGIYLIIKNRALLGGAPANISNHKEENDRIRKRLEDPIDFPDGRMSLSVIKKYIEYIDKNRFIEKPCEFKFVEKVEANTEIEGRTGSRKRLYFETRLPIFNDEGE